MSAQRYTLLQISIICFLVFLLGGKALLRHPDWFGGEQQNDELYADLGQDHSSTTPAKSSITLGSATSTEDSGFFDYILPIFRAATGLDVHVEAVGTERALAIAARGDVDALLVHDRVGEDNLVADGYGIDRRDVMHNDFVIIGPSSDPAGIRGLRDALTAFALIAAKGAPFVSRGDSGGTYVMERRLWQSAGVEPKGQAWYRIADGGIGATLNFAGAVNAYALTDRAAWANFKTRENLEILTEGDPALINIYSSIIVNPAKWPDTKFKEAKRWHDWLTSRSGLDAITSFHIDGQDLFFSPHACDPACNSLQGQCQTTGGRFGSSGKKQWNINDKNL
jgi:tungstate transport system substrate-binding protein